MTKPDYIELDNIFETSFDYAVDYSISCGFKETVKSRIDDLLSYNSYDKETDSERYEKCQDGLIMGMEYALDDIM